MDCGALTKPQSTALLLSSAIFTGAVLLRFSLIMTRLNFGRSGKLRKDLSTQKCLFSVLENPLSCWEARKKLLFFEAGAIFCLNKKCPSVSFEFCFNKGWSALLIEVWKSLFGARFLEAFCSVNPNPFTRTISLCAKIFPKLSKFEFGCTKFSAFLANFLSKSKVALWTILSGSQTCWC